MTYARETLAFEVPTPKELGLRRWSDGVWSSDNPADRATSHLTLAPAFTIVVLSNGQARLLVERVKDDGSVAISLDRTYFSFGVALLAMQMFEGSPLPVLLPGFKMEPTHD